MLTPSERVKLIKAIAPLLGNEEWSILDLTLRQFKLPTTDMWSGERDRYVIEMISSAPDERLLALASHLGIDSHPRSSAIDPTFWTDNHLRLFVSHLAKYKSSAGLLQQELGNYQISAFIAHKDIEPTKKWQDEIELALSTADCLVAMVTRDFHQSNWTDQEIGFALGRGIPILSLRMGLDPYGFLAREQAIQGEGVEAKKMARAIFSVFVKNKQTRKRMAESLVHRFGNSNQFQEAKENFALLEKVEYWDEHLTKAVKTAVKKNNQIADAWGIPDKVKLFLEKNNNQ